MKEREEGLENEETPRTPPDEDDIDYLQMALREEKARAERYLDSWKRAQADFINYKRRCEQERDEARQLANSALILTLLPVLDDLDRALASVPPESSREPWVEGVRLVQRKFTATLESYGVKPIEAEGKPFDPCLHEATACVSGEEGMVVGEIKKGYMLGDKVLRPSLVLVGSGEEAGESGE
jgi:molecular chaperone GrpE